MLTLGANAALTTRIESIVACSLPMLRLYGTILAVSGGMVFAVLAIALFRQWGKSFPGRPALVIASVGAIWGLLGWRLMGVLDNSMFDLSSLNSLPTLNLEYTGGIMLFCSALVGIGTLGTAQIRTNLITLPGVIVGVLFSVYMSERTLRLFESNQNPIREIAERFIAVVGIAALVLILRFVYKGLLHREGIALGDVGLMAMLAAWLGPKGALLALTLGICLDALVAAALLLNTQFRHTVGAWAMGQFPLGACFCTGGIVSCLWGPLILATYLH